MTEVRQLDPSEIEVASTSLADAFADDPPMEWAGRFRDDPTRLVPMMRAFLAMRFRRPTPLLFTNADQAANAMWDAPGQPVMSPGENVRATPALLRSFRLGVTRGIRLSAAMEKGRPEQPHYCLLMLGARRDRQGEGLGSAVIAPMLERCDSEGVPAYLENSKPRNTAFYARHGFRPLDPLALPPGCPPVMPMWRDPR